MLNHLALTRQDALWMRVADYIAQRLAVWGLDTCFAVTGGGAMHLNDALGADPNISVHYMHHEQACAMAAEGFARIAARPAILNVTAGPGAINALNGVFGAYTDSIPMVVVSGQARRDTIADLSGQPELRQLGDQEARTTDIVSSMVKYVALVSDPPTIARVLDEAVVAAISGRPGPVWVDVPVDVQGTDVPDLDPHAPLPQMSEPTSVEPSELAELLQWLASGERPVILAGSGIRCAGVADGFAELVEVLGVPVVTAWTHDTIASDSRYFAGRAGTIGTRAGNFVVQNCDRLLVLGSRLNIRQVSYNWNAFAENAEIAMVDIDPAELSKSYLNIDRKLTADLRTFIPELVSAARETRWHAEYDGWLDWIRHVRQQFEPKRGDYPERPDGINAYHLIMELFENLRDDHVVICGDATATIVPFQVGALRDGMRLISNSGCASMGHDLPAAFGAATAPGVGPIVALAGDGSIMMNIQELATIAACDVDILVVVLDNGGYLSIKQTQRNFFGREFGASGQSGVGFPDFSALAAGFGLPVVTLRQGEDWKSKLRESVASTGPRVVVAHLDQVQEFEPRLKSKMVDGKITTPSLDDMYPHLDAEVLDSVRASARQI